MDPESARRLASGFWKRDHDLCTDTTTWKCDKRKLNDQVAEAMLDRDFREMFHKSGLGILDRLFGEGTARAYSYKTAHTDDRWVAMRFNPFGDEGREDMAYGTYATTNNNWTTTTTATTSTFTDGGNLMFPTGSAKKPDESYSWAKPRSSRKKMIRNLPFAAGRDLLATMQRDFDYWAGAQMDAIRG